MAIATAGFVGLLGTVDPGWRKLCDRATPVASSIYYPPVSRTDLPEFERLIRRIDEEIGHGRKGFVVLSSSADLHVSMFAAAERSLRLRFPAGLELLPTADVDRVSGFPEGLFRAGLVVVSDPPQTHLRPEEQQVILVPCRLLATGKGIGRGFDRLPGTYTLDHGVTVTLYRRTRAIQASDFDSFCEELRRAHPDRPFVYRPAVAVDELVAVPE